MLNQLSSVFNPASLYLPQNLPVLQKCGRVNTSLSYRGLNTQGEFTEYEVKRAVASVVAQGFTFANVPYAFFQPVGEENGWQVFRSECGETRIPVSDYRRLLVVSKRTTYGKKPANGGIMKQPNTPHVVQRQSGLPAIFQGVTGLYQYDLFSRLVFWPDEAGFNSTAYEHTTAELGQWDEWTFEVHVHVYQDGDVLVIQL